MKKRKAARREEAIERQESWAKLSRTQQLDALERRGHGDCMQALKLYAAISFEETATRLQEKGD